MRESLLDKLPGGKILAKDLSVDKTAVPGNPFCRYDCEDQSRKYCSKDLWESSDDKYVIPDDGKIPRKHVACGCCGMDSYVENDECGRCGKPIFECPADGCDEEVHGRPGECPACGVGYNWDN